MLLDNNDSLASAYSPEQRLIQSVVQGSDPTIASPIGLAERLLGLPMARLESTTPYSSLNNNGSPLQVCISYREAAQQVRLIVDPDAVTPISSIRLSKAKKVLESHLQRSEADSLFAVWLRDSVNHWIPDDCHERTLASGYFWLGTDLEQRGTALYLSPHWQSTETQWRHLTQWLNYFGIDPKGVVKNLGQHARLASIALEGRSSTESKLKVYWRLGSEFNLADQPHPLFQDKKIKSFLQHSIGSKSLSTNGLLLSMCWNLSSCEIEEVKIDICGHCLNHKPSEWQALLGRLSKCFGFSSPITAPYFSVGADIAFISLALDVSRKSRFNIYWKPGVSGEGYAAD